MQNRGALWIFTILLALACAYQLSFSFFTSRLETRAHTEAELRADSTIDARPDTTYDRDELVIGFENDYLRDHAEDVVYPVIGKTYRECKESEINLGLDLKGGMAVTLEVSIPEMVENLSENNTDPAFTAAMANARARQTKSSADFITLFGEEWAKIPNHPPLSAIFYSPDRQAMFEREGSDADYLAALRREAESALNNTERILRTRIDKFGVSQPSIQKQQFTGRISIELPGVKDKARVRRLLQGEANLEFYETFENTDIGPVLDKVNAPLSALLHPGLAADSTATDTLATDSLTAAKPDTAATAVDTLTAASDTTDLTDTIEEPIDSVAARAEAEKRAPLASKLMLMVDQRGWMRGPTVGRANVNDTAAVNRLLETEIVRGALPVDARLAWAAKPQTVELTAGGSAQFLDLYALKIPRDGKPRLDGGSISSAMQDFDMKGDVEVRMRMNTEGAQIWRLMTGENVGKCIAIVLDDLVQSAPVVQGEIPGGSSSISMGTGDLNAQIREAEDLANILKAGALPAPARIIDETVIGPSLGAENIKQGLISFALAMMLVVLFMIIYYNGSGWVANVALLANIFVLMGALASFQSSLTLPGIAGIVLTVGMAVDANVLINERIREELRHGKMLKSAVDLGYKHAMSAIIDANVTHFVVAVILIFFGSGPIKSFGVTLALGILTSLFTAIFISRLIISRRLEKGKSMTFWHNWNKDIFANAKYKFMAKRKYFYFVSGAVIAAGLISALMPGQGFNYGVDFSGGREYVVKFEKPVEAEQVRVALEGVMKDESGVPSGVKVVSYGGKDQVKITTNYLVDQTGLDTDRVVDGKLQEGLSGLGAKFPLEASRKVDPTISDDIRLHAWYAVGFALLFIFIYIALRFRTWQFGLGALLSLAHDALVVVGLYSLLYKIMPFSLEIDEHFIAAILTVIGYSINDTVVVFDRIREYLQDHKRDKWATVFDKAINSTLGRTINTSVTVLIVLLVIFLFGADSIRGFVFAMLVGIAVGTYSSIFIASAVVVDLHKDEVPEKAPTPARAVA